MLKLLNFSLGSRIIIPMTLRPFIKVIRVDIDLQGCELVCLSCLNNGNCLALHSVFVFCRYECELWSLS